MVEHIQAAVAVLTLVLTVYVGLALFVRHLGNG